MGRPRLVVIIDGGGGDRDESPDSGRREASVRGGGRSSVQSGREGSGWDGYGGRQREGGTHIREDP